MPSGGQPARPYSAPDQLGGNAPRSAEFSTGANQTGDIATSAGQNAGLNLSAAQFAGQTPGRVIQTSVLQPANPVSGNGMSSTDAQRMFPACRNRYPPRTVPARTVGSREYTCDYRAATKVKEQQWQLANSPGRMATRQQAILKRWTEPLPSWTTLAAGCRRIRAIPPGWQRGCRVIAGPGPRASRGYADHRDDRRPRPGESCRACPSHGRTARHRPADGWPVHNGPARSGISRYRAPGRRQARPGRDVMNRTMRTLAAAALAAVLAGCGTATHPASAPAPGPVPTASAANVQTCQDYAKQRAWIKAHEATLTLVDIATIGGWIETDSVSVHRATAHRHDIGVGRVRARSQQRQARCQPVECSPTSGHRLHCDRRQGQLGRQVHRAGTGGYIRANRG